MVYGPTHEDFIRSLKHKGISTLENPLLKENRYLRKRVAELERMVRASPRAALPRGAMPPGTLPKKAEGHGN